MIDCGRFQTIEELNEKNESPTKNAISVNLEIYKLYLVTELMLFQGVNYEKYRSLKKEISEATPEELLYFVKNDMLDNETFKEYVKRRIN